MNETYIIPINGVIGEGFTVNDLLMHLNNAKNYARIQLNINSLGGNVEAGIKMYELLKNSGKYIISTNTGDVASIAVSLFLAGIERTFNPALGMFLIHNPWIDPLQIKDGIDSNAATKLAKELKSMDSTLAKQYSEVTGSDAEILKGFMEQNQPLTVEQIEGLRFAKLVTTEQQQSIIKQAIAYYKPKKQMENEKLSILEKMFNKLFKHLKINALVLQDVNGTELEFPDAQTPDQIVVGTKVNVQGEPKESYTLPNGSIISVSDGVVTAITEPQMAVDETQALKEENAALKTELESLKAANAEATKQALEVKAEFFKFKSQFKAEVKPADTPAEVKQEEIKSFTYKRKK